MPRRSSVGAGRLLPRRALYGLAAAVLVLDQLSKLWAVAALERGASLPVVPGFFQLSLVHNYGAAWGVLQGRASILALAAVATILAIVVVSIRSGRLPLPLGLGLAACLGGASGNLVDRLRFGYVVDFFDVRLPLPGGRFYDWPVFNVADSFICIGVALLLWYFLVAERRQQPDPLPRANEAVAPDV